MRRLSLLPTLVVAAFLAAGAASASASTILVTTTSDPDEAHCPSSVLLGPCSIRAALARNDADGGGDVVQLRPGIYPTATGLQPHSGVSIVGTGSPADTVLDADGGGSVFDIEIAKGGADQAVTIAHVTLRNSTGPAVAAKFARPLVVADDVFADNRATTLDGGAIDLLAGTDARVSSTRFAGNSAPAGGAIATSGATTDVNTLDISDSEFADNAATDAAGPGGGAIVAGFGDVTIRRTRFGDNVAPRGGALANLDTNNAFGLQPSLAISDSSFDGNQATGAGGALSLTTSTVGSLIADNITLAGDSAADGSEIAGTTHAVLLRNSVVAGTLHRDCAGAPVLSRGHNFATDATCALQGSGDVVGADPRLEPAGTPIPSLVPRTDSPLLDAADPAGCAQTAENQVARPQGDGCDIGAGERPATAPSATTKAATGSTAAGTVTPGGLPTAVTIEFGPTTAYGATLQLGAVRGWLSQPVSANLPLAPGTVVHYRVVASNDQGAAVGGDEIATAPPAPSTSSAGPVATRPPGAGPGGVPPGIPPATSVAARLSALRLTHHHHLLAWSLSRAVTVHFVLGRRGAHGRFSTAARFSHHGRSGSNMMALPRTALAALRPGRYRLTATPAGARPAEGGVHVDFRVSAPPRRVRRS